jgi:hypothetical protein
LRVLGCVLALAVAFATLLALWRLARDSDLLRVAGFVLMAVAVLAVVAMPLRRVRVLGLPGTIVSLLSAFAIRVLGGILLVAVAVEWYPDVRAAVLEDPALDEAARFGVAFAATLLAPVVFAGLPGRASLHREYRQRLESCFGVPRREDGGAERMRSAPLSPAPPEEPAYRFPRLLVCATANVRGRGSDGRRWHFQPFVLSHDRCGVPGDVDAGFSTSQLELGEAPAGLLTRRKEPLLSLFTAVAATGAAVSPSMGRYTVPSLRPIIAALNFRLGRWIPNPYSARARAKVAARATPGPFDTRRRLGSGYDELVPEMLGFDGPRIYLSDGGHYDNLGLLGLLEQRPEAVWCVDASPDPHGRAAELRRVVSVARSRDIEIDVDCDAFAAGANGLYGATHTIGTVTYSGGAQAQLVVLKLGLVAASDAELLARRRRRGFPFHPTTRQIYDEDRMDAYRRLGREVGARALAEVAPDA